MKKFRLVVVSSIFFSNTFLQACAIASEDKNDPLSKLRWVEDANAMTDARSAMEKKDYRLLSMATRSISIPGIDFKEETHLKQICGVKPLRYTSDVIRSQEQLKLQKKVRRYAKEYNTIMKKVCLNKQ